MGQRSSLVSVNDCKPRYLRSLRYFYVRLYGYSLSELRTLAPVECGVDIFQSQEYVVLPRTMSFNFDNVNQTDTGGL